jgi:hypothetical protein
MNPQRSPRLTLHLVAVSIITILLTQININAQCDECIDKYIVVFDADIDVPPPTDTSALEMRSWYLLFELSKITRYYSRFEDPSRDCFNWMDAGKWATDVMEDSLNLTGPTHAETPPPGSIEGAAYILTGLIEPAGANHFYSLTWHVECGTSREVVRSTTVNFSTDSSMAYLDIIAQLAAAGLWPLSETIEEFEIQKREEDMEVARTNRGSIKVTPKKTELQPNDSTEVELELIDGCDSYPLKNREIILEPTRDPVTDEKICNGPTGGTVHPTRVTTDENGKATVTFVAGSEGGLGIIEAVYPYKKPHGWRDDMFGQTSINLSYSMWQVNVSFSHKSNSSTNTKTIEGENTTVSTGDSYYSADATLRFVYENKNPDNVGKDKLVISMDDPSAGTVYGLNYLGNYKEGGAARIDKWDGDGNLFASYFSQSQISSQGCRSITEPGLDFDYSTDGIPSFQLSGTIWRIGWSSEKISGFPEGEPYKFNEPYSAMNAMFFGFEPQASFQHSGSHFSANYTESLTKNEQGTSTSYTIKVKADFSGKSVPENIKENSSANLPEKFALFQNYPNPFNPNTTFEYALPANIRVSIIIYNLLGQEVAHLVDGFMYAGYHRVIWSADNIPSGVYFYRMKTGNFSDTKKFLLIR